MKTRVFWHIKLAAKMVICFFALAACDSRQAEINSCLSIKDATAANHFFADLPKNVQSCSKDSDCVVEVSSCGKSFPANRDFQSCIVHAQSMADSVKDCIRGEISESLPVCQSGRCGIEDPERILSDAYTLTSDVVTNNQYFFYSDLWTVSVPLDFDVVYDNGIPEYKSSLPTINFDADRSVTMETAIIGASAQFDNARWVVDQEGRLSIDDRVYQYSADHRALFSPLRDESDQLGYFIIRKDFASYFRRNPL